MATLQQIAAMNFKKGRRQECTKTIRANMIMMLKNLIRKGPGNISYFLHEILTCCGGGAKNGAL